jgi:glycosyltransferase involved in cell wall biosynthesis/GT2 family glycosyltransferase
MQSVTPKQGNESPLKQGNAAMRQGDNTSAIRYYISALAQAPALAKTITANLAMARQKYRAQRSSATKPSAAVCGWELAHNAAGRVYTLAMLYETFADVEIIGSLFPSYGREVWEPIRATAIPKHCFVVEDESNFIDQAIQLVAAHPYDIVHLSKPRAPNIFLGILYKLIWDAKVLMDIDDEELAFVGAETPISVDEYIQQHGKLPDMKDLAGKDWTRLAVGLVKEFDGVTVCNTPLQQRYGGEIIRHARDEKLFKPSPELKRKSRDKYGIPQDAKVVLFFGTPREHKGLIETAQAIASLKRPEVIYCIAGSFADQSLKQRLLEIKGCDYKFLPNQPISNVPEVLAIADCCVLLQDTNSTIARFQTPAKLSDALAMGIPVLTAKNESTIDLLELVGINFVSQENIAEQLVKLIDGNLKDNSQTAKFVNGLKAVLSLRANAEILQSSALGVNDGFGISKTIQEIAVKLGFLFIENKSQKTGGLKFVEKYRTKTHIQRVTNVVLSENPAHHPDFFLLKSAEQLADSAVLTWVTSLTDLDSLTRLIIDLDKPFELLILTGRDTASKIELFNLPHACQRVTIVGFPDKTKRAGSFVQAMNSGALWRYTTLILLDCDKRFWPKDIWSVGKSVEYLGSDINSSIGLISSSLHPIDDFISEFRNKYLGTWYARLHRTLPVDPFLVPQGIIVVKTSILHQINGLDLKAYNFDGLAPQGDRDAYNTLLCVLGAFVVEGAFRSITFSEFASIDFDKQPTQPERNIKTIAFFLPQFHVIPENDRWWGKGFTEWNNVVRTKPLFRSHYQPKLPADLGFYDLRSNVSQIAQAELAQKYGIHGFCYYYYYFNGKKLLNEPIEQMLSSGKPDFPFCVCWANENWSRNWDGQNKHVLMEQNYSNDSNKALIHEFIPMMKDKRYIRHHGKPVLLVYRIKIIPNWLETAAMWREECRKGGVGEVHLCSIRFGLEPLEGMPTQHGLDAYVLFPPQDTNFVDVRDKVHDLHPEFGGSLLSYDAVVDGDIARFKHGYPWPVHRGAMLGWDNTARRLTAARIFTGCTPMRYRSWLSEIVHQEERHNPDKDTLLFINAWNEWAEGTTLEPDQRYGTAYLKATRSVVAPFLKGKSLSTNNDSSVTGTNKPISAKRFIKELLVPKLPERFEGKSQYKPSAPTVLLCAHISGHQLFGGERSFLDVLEALYRLGLNIVVTLPSSNNKAYINHIANSTIAIYSLPYKQWISAREPDPMLQLQFCDIIAIHNISIVYSNTIVLIEPAMAARQMNRLSVVHARELITIDDSLRERIGLPVQTIIKTVYGRYDFVIANSKATEFTFAREGRTFYVPNAVDTKELALDNKLGQRIKVGIVSSNIPKKGISDFIEVAKLCKDLANSVEFVVIGPENAQVEQWKKQVVSGQLPSNLKFLGYRDTPKAAMAELNILLNLSSFAESFGRTVAEAMAASRPVIVYQWGALPELVQHDVTGFLVPYGDTRKVSDYIRLLCGKPDLIEKMGKAGQIAVLGKFSHDALFNHLDTAITAIQKSPDWKMLEITEITTKISNPVTVVIPVYNAPAEVKNCIDSVLRHTPLNNVEIVIINDGSTDPQIADVLNAYVGKAGVRILQNEKNIGYTKTVNRGLKEAGDRDVVLLNSDTIVTPTWLNALRASAYSKPKIGTVTAMSDNAGAFSFPKQGVANPKPDDMPHDEYAMRVIDQTLNCEFPEVPTGSGFCIYIRRDLINEIGVFDEEGFPRGYGEENDFCMRAIKAGWNNVVSSWTFVFHVRTASFKGEKHALVKAGVDVVTKRYPHYAKQVKEALEGADMNVLRKSTDVLTMRNEHG